MNNPAVIGALAGLVSAMLFASAAASAVAAVFLVYITPLPLMIAGLGWGIRASLIGLGVGMLAAAALFSINVSITYALMLAGPAALLVYLALLSRPDPQGPQGLAWYPPGRLIAWAAMMAGAVGGGSAVALAVGTGDYDTGVRELFNETLLPALQQGQQELSEEQIGQTVQLMSGILPGAVSAVWLLIMLINVWLGGKIASVSGRLIRPSPTLSDLDYPRFLPIAFLLALLGTTVFAGLTAAIASAFTGAILLAYLVLGLVVVHVITRGSAFQPLILVLLYVGIVLVGWLALLVALLGVAEPLLRLRQRVQNRRDGGGPPDGPRPD